MSDDHKTTIRLPRSEHTAARIKAVQANIALSEVIRRLLALWVAGKVVLDEPPPETTVERSQ